ncbi:uncharacterized protein LOC123299309 [Chrysoperla carnea]|uniref:uncharacterized protein LOC123299309 n=1 Tax=Chrysoperla carnea TaxID=189513 RepID=UPI001D078619|nr:uncharacterized protein LOC123299309 [Chrysoperla carnea]
MKKMAAFIQGDNERGYMTTCDDSDRESPKSPWEIRCGKLITSCECVKRNGLQNECNIPNCVNKTKKLYENEISNNPKSGRNEIQLKPVPIPSQKALPRMSYGEQIPQQNNVPVYEDHVKCEFPSQVYQETSPPHQPQYQTLPQNVHPSEKFRREEVQERQDRMISAMVNRRNALHEKEMICPEQCPEKLLDCNPLQGLDPSSKQYTHVQQSYFNSPQNNTVSQSNQLNHQNHPVYSPNQRNQQYNPVNSPNPQYNPVNPNNPQQQYIINHYEPGGNAYPHHCIPSPTQGNDPNQPLSQNINIPPNEMRSPRIKVKNSPSQHGIGQPVQYQLQPCCMYASPKPCCQYKYEQDPTSQGQVHRPDACCEGIVTGNVPTTQYYLPPSNGDNLTPSDGGNFYNGNTPHQHQHTNGNIPHQHYHLPTNNGNIPQQPNYHTHNQQLQSGKTTTLLNQPYTNPQYPNNDQMYPLEQICNCNKNSPIPLSQNNPRDYERIDGGEDQNIQVDLVGNQYGQPQEPIQPKTRSYVEPLIPEPQELSEYPPQIRRYRLDGKECK